MVEKLSTRAQGLLNEPAFCQVATNMSDGSPHISQVWVSTDGNHVLGNTFEGAQKLKNIRRDPSEAVNVVEPVYDGRLGNIRGRVVE